MLENTPGMEQNNNLLRQYTFGSMRLGSLSSHEATDLLGYLLKSGVRRFHSSTEYDSFELFRQSLRQACKNTAIDPHALKHIVKIAAPHFGEKGFNSDVLVQRINEYREQLDAPQIEIVQWMARGDLADERARLDILVDSTAKIGSIVNSLKQAKTISRFGCFPYTDSFCEEVIRQPWCDVLFGYLNPLEKENLRFIKKLRENQTFFCIRPFFPLLEETDSAWNITDLLRFALEQPSVETLAISTGSKQHAGEIIAQLKSDLS